MVDAHDGELVAELPRNGRVEEDKAAKAADLLGDQREFGVRLDTASSRGRMFDAGRNIHTHVFNFRDIGDLAEELPGPYAENPPDPWDAAAVSCHANTAIVVDWLAQVLEREGIDDNGGKVVSTVNCVLRGPDTNGREWKNALRLPSRWPMASARSTASCVRMQPHWRSLRMNCCTV